MSSSGKGAVALYGWFAGSAYTESSVKGVFPQGSLSQDVMKYASAITSAQVGAHPFSPPMSLDSRVV
jgi:hypothetical protein